jgi:hypothetical protein
MNQKQVRGAFLVCVLLAVAALAGLAGAQQAPRAVQYEAVADGLSSPRHLAFDADGTLYVAEAGSGGDQCIGEGENQRCIGQTGAVTVVDGDTQERLADDLVSYALADGSDTTGPHDVAWDAEGNLMVIVGLGADPARRGTVDFFGAISNNLGQLVQVADDGSWTNEIDVAAYESTANPDGGELDSNPYAIERVEDGYLVADAGANALLHVTDAGVITTVAVFPPRMVEFPPGSGDMIPMQAVPTSVAVGPDGAYYVGQLTGFPFPVDGANVYRVVEGEEPEVYASGFTNIVDLAFAEDGTLYVVEITSNSLLSGDPHGSLIRVEDDGSQTVIADDLFMPGGVAIGDDGHLYVTTRTALGDGMGEVLRINAQFTAYLPVIVPPGTAAAAP